VMFSTSNPTNKEALTLFVCASMLCTGGSSQDAQSGYTLRARTELVLVNVVARDKNWNLIGDLNKQDFTILEDNKAQQIVSFDLENTDAVIPTAVTDAKLLGTLSPKTNTNPAAANSGAVPELKHRRLIVLFFDLTSMQAEEIDRAARAAENFIDKQMVSADLVSITSLGASLVVNQDFTSNKDILKKTLQLLNQSAGQGFEAGTTGTTEGTPDTGQAFTVDDTEYNIFNTDHRLDALRSVAERLAPIEQKKSLIYFSGGIDRTGIENQSALRAATNSAVRANLAIYTIDIRGLQAVVPGGEAQRASLRGTSVYSGQAVLDQYNSNFTTQETLVTLAGDTGGRAFLNSNDFGQVFTAVRQDTSAYYILGYHSNNPARDGRFRRITVRVNRPGVELDFRRGYYAPIDFQHSTKEDRERQLEEELRSDLPTTDLAVYLSTGYFRISDKRFFVPVSIVIPSSQILFTRTNDQDRATLDVLGVIFDADERPVSRLRDTVKLSLSSSQLVQPKNLQYNSDFVLAPGTYHLKFVVRENHSGRLGSFETDLTVPDLKGVPMKISSVVLASRLQPTKKKPDNPLVHNGLEVIPSVTHVFSSGQHLYLYYEVYDPAHDDTAGKSAGAEAVRLLTNVAFFRGNTKAYETPVVESHQLNAPERRTAVFQVDVPLSELKPGFYTCQVNIIDDAAGQFRFPRLDFLVRDQAMAPGGT
jgi:VWFA-related protein